VAFSGDLLDTTAFGDAVFVVVPSRFCRALYRQIAPVLRRNQLVVSLTKGFDPASGKRMSELMEATFEPYASPGLAVLSGPSFAREVAAGRPTAVVVASRSGPITRRLQRFISSAGMRVYSSRDVAGVEVAGATKNVIAIAAGICDALDLGLNARAALIARGLAEITRLGVALGARKATFAGLAGVGDLVLTCSADLSRNYRVGRALGEGRALAEILESSPAVAEGVQATTVVRRLAKRHGVDMPIAEQVYRIVRRGRAPTAAVTDLMLREPRAE